MSIFAKIITREIPAKIVYEDDLCIAFHDINPAAPVHILLVPKKPIVSLDHAAPEDAPLLGYLLLKVAEIARKFGIAEKGYRVVTNIGPEGAQSVPHLHFHILGGRQMGGF
ncbi:MAG: histidine triad nucleotide-binding protein [Bdellovibrionota bacterium]